MPKWGTAAAALLLVLLAAGAPPTTGGKKIKHKPKPDPIGLSRHRVHLGRPRAPPVPPSAAEELEREGTYPPDWHETMVCREEYTMRELLQGIHKDLEPWMFREKPPITREMHDVANLPPTAVWLTEAAHKFAFIDGKAYHTLGYNMSSLERDAAYEWYVVFDRLSKKGNIPDVEFVIQNNDAGAIKRGEFVPGTDMPFPLFSYCKYDTDHDITWPHSHFWQYEFEKKVFSNRAILDLRWAEKKEVAFWRGSITNGGGETEEDIYGRKREAYEYQPAPRRFFQQLGQQPEAEGVLDIRNHTDDYVPIEKHNTYKYLVDIDGIGCSTRFQQLLGMNSVPLKMSSRMRQYFEPLLQPYKHYIPFWHTGNNDLINITKWLRKNDDLARDVAGSAYKFAQEHLREPHVLCYWEMLFEEYAKLLAFKPKLSDYPFARPVSELMAPDGRKDGVICTEENERRPRLCKETPAEAMGIDLNELPPEEDAAADGRPSSELEGELQQEVVAEEGEEQVAPAEAPSAGATEGPGEAPAPGPDPEEAKRAEEWAGQWVDAWREENPRSRVPPAPPAPFVPDAPFPPYPSIPPEPPGPPTAPPPSPPSPPRFRHAWSRRHGTERDRD